jgi:hypothetical protein
MQPIALFDPMLPFSPAQAGSLSRVSPATDAFVAATGGQ